MAKRRAEEPLLLRDSSSKRSCRPLCGVDLQLGRMAPAGSVNPPSLLALLGSRSRKRPYYFQDPEIQEEEEDLALHRCDTRKHAALTVQTSGSFQDRSISRALTSSKKRPREDSTGSEIVINKANDKADEDTNTEDSSYNSFQFWRTPLPELDLSLLEDDRSQAKDKSKVSCSDAMET